MVDNRPDRLLQLQQFLRGRSDGDWEHSEGICIQSLDNPGWMVRVSLVGTHLEGARFETRQYENSPDDWLVCRVKDGFFEGFGDPEKLTELIDLFFELDRQIRGGSAS